MSGHVSYWLTPAEPDRIHWDKIIRSLAAEFDAPIFEPHVTLYSAALNPDDHLGEIVRAAAAETPEVILEVAGISHSTQFTKTLFVEFAGNSALTNLSAELKLLSLRPGNYELKPHLSLIYAPLPPEVLKNLEHELSLPTHIRFDTVKAVVSGGLTRTRADVEAWQIVASAKLGE